MIHPRLALLPLIGLCALLSACSDKADKLSDGDLARMLHSEGLADERVDAAAVDCLRAWSDDSNLAAGLPANLTDETGKGDCRRWKPRRPLPNRLRRPRLVTQCCRLPRLTFPG